MDALHDESIRLADFHAAPMCTPTRGQLTDGALEEGVAIPIARARIMIDGRIHTQRAELGDKGVTFSVDLEPGPTLLHTWFDDERNQPICGAYYVYAERSVDHE